MNERMSLPSIDGLLLIDDCIVVFSGAEQKAPIYSSDEDLSEEESRKRLMKAKRPAIDEVSQNLVLEHC